MTRWTRTALLLAFLLAAVSPVIYWKLSREKVETVTVIKASAGTIQQTISATGSVEAQVEAGRAHVKPIRTGLRNEEIVEVISGLQAGDGVIDQGRGKVKDGQAVEVLNEKR